MKEIIFSKNFKKEYKLMLKRGKNPAKMTEILSILSAGETLPSKFRDHKLIGQYKGSRDLHIEPDWILIYKTTQNAVIFERTGSHSDLFK